MQGETIPLETVVPEMKLAAKKLRDHMDQIQRELNESFTRLKRLLSFGAQRADYLEFPRT
jgi:hypothetical protein